MPLMAQKLLVIGYGNPGRGDDGLGPALAAQMQSLALPHLAVEIDYQMTVDHAELISRYAMVVFADAEIGLDAPFRFSQVDGSAPKALGSHQVSPEAAIALADLLFGHAPSAWTMGISGCAFGEVREGLSPEATANLAMASDFLHQWLVQAKLQFPSPLDG